MRQTLRHLGCASLASLAVAGAGLGVVSGVSALRGSAPPSDAAAKAEVVAGFGNMPLSFVENKGQVAGPARFYVQGVQTSVSFGTDGVTYSLTRPAPGEASSAKAASAEMADGLRAPGRSTRAAVKLDFVGAAATEPTAGALAPGVVSYFASTPERSRTGLPTYAGVTYPNLWPGIDATYSGTGSKLEYTFVVHPGADPSQIRLAYRGADGVHLNDQGQVEVTTAAGGFTDDRPTSFQDIDGKRVAVSSAWAADATDGSFRLPVGSYDRTRDLVIDPVQFIYAGFVGGVPFDVTVGGDGSAYVTGLAAFDTLPVTVGPDLSRNGGSDAFVAKVNPAGTGFDYLGFIGGSDHDRGQGIAVDQLGAAYVIGETLSADFPTSVGPDTSYDGPPQSLSRSLLFAAKVTPDGTGLAYSGFIGDGRAGDIAVDLSGAAYVTGTGLFPADLPAVVGPDLTSDGEDAFVAKINVAGTGFDYAGYVGGSSFDVGTEIAVDGAGSAYLTGYTGSADFPVSVGPDLTYNGDQQDAYVAKVAAAGTGLVYSGFIGGDSVDRGNGIAVDATGNAYVGGDTSSTKRTFPATRGSFDQIKGSYYSDGFLVKVDRTGASVVYGGYVGGLIFDSVKAVAVDAAGNAYVTGETTTNQKQKFPVTADAPDPTFNGVFDAFVVKIDAPGSNVVYGTYLGGAGRDSGRSIAVDGEGNAYVVGDVDETSFATFPVTVGPDTSPNGPAGAIQGFIAKIGSQP